MAVKKLDEETTQKILRQVNFYFSDSNLPRDNFLKKTIGESEDGMVSLALICSFSRMRNHLSLGDVKQEDISDDTVNAVAETLRKSTFLKISEDGKKVGRSTEIAKLEEVIEQVDVRTVAASPLEHSVKLEDIESYFSQFGKVNSVRLPRHAADKRLFCGTALIEFSTDEDAESILKQSLVFGGLELELKPKKEFDAEQVLEAEKFANFSASSHKNNTKAEANYYPKGVIVAFKLKSTKDNGKVESVDNEEKTEEVSLEGKEEKETEESKDEAKTEGERKSSADVYKDNMEVVLREDLKTVFENYGTVKFVDFRIGEESGYIRFEEPEGAQKARAAAVLLEEGGLTVKNYIATLEPVTGEAEEQYWSLLRGSQDRHHNKGNRGRGGRFSRGGKFSRSRDNDNGAGRGNKVRKVAA